jgi:hypothetical protein
MTLGTNQAGGVQRSLREQAATITEAKRQRTLNKNASGAILARFPERITESTKGPSVAKMNPLLDLTFC